MDRKELVTKLLEAFWGGNPNMLERYLSPACVLHQCGFLGPVRGADAIRELAGRDGRMGDRRWRVESIVAEGDTVALRWHSQGIHRASGTPVAFDSMTFVRFEGDRIAEIWNIQDEATIGSQIETAVGAGG